MTSTVRVGRALARQVLAGGALLLAISVLGFSSLEFFPALLDRIDLQSVRYYAFTTNYVPDPSLVVVPRKKKKIVDFRYAGDQLTAPHRLEELLLDYRASYTDQGFRSNSSPGPFQIVVVGDSYVEIGESDLSTFPEKLRAQSGMPTLNLGRGLYGPVQYLEVFKRHGLAPGMRYALMCFFSGNDLSDTEAYLAWEHGGVYGKFTTAEQPFFRRYVTAMADIGDALGKSIRRIGSELIAAPGGTDGRDSSTVARLVAPHAVVALIRLEGRDVPMAFTYWNRPLTASELMREPAWQRMRSALAEFKLVAERHGIVPVLLFIPTKLEVYGQLVSPESEHRFLERLAGQLRVEDNSAQALSETARALDILHVNLLPHFRELAARGELLYFPFDTHWNAAGRQVAAEHVARVLRILN